MARVIIFGLLLTVVGTAFGAPGTLELEALQLLDDSADAARECDPGQFFSVARMDCRKLPGTPAVGGKCPAGRIAYTYLDETRCRVVPKGAAVSTKCAKGRYFSTIVRACQSLPGFPAANKKCPDTDATFEYLGETRCYPIFAGIPVPNHKCPKTDVKLTYKGETRCHKVV